MLMKIKNPHTSHRGVFSRESREGGPSDPQISQIYTDSHKLFPANHAKGTIYFLWAHSRVDRGTKVHPPDINLWHL